MGKKPDVHALLWASCRPVRIELEAGVGVRAGTSPGCVFPTPPFAKKAGEYIRVLTISHLTKSGSVGFYQAARRSLYLKRKQLRRLRIDIVFVRI